MKSAKGQFSFDRRTCGLLMHVTSLPGPHGSGDLGRSAYEFVDFLHAAGQTWWQMLPVNPPGDGYSPYSCSSTFAGSPYLISLEILRAEGLLTKSEIAPDRSFDDDRLNFEAVWPWRMNRLRLAYARFKSLRGSTAALNRFSRLHASWLDDFALFSAMKDAHGQRPWSTWARDLRLRDPTAIADARRMLADEVRFHTFVQFLFDRQWTPLRQYANSRGVGLIGDIPIFVAYDSAEVWAHRELFLLDADGQPKVVSGCPPDFFNKLGQKWGHPHYYWKKHQASGFAWWVDRFAETLRLFDGVRIDHFLGFHRVWRVPADADDAIVGEWEFTPGRRLFQTLQKEIGRPPIIAEDLGAITDAAAALRDEFHFPGMSVMQFGFAGGWMHLPHNQPRARVIYTGTHDNDTLHGYFDKVAAAGVRNRAERAHLARMKRYVNTNGDGSNLHWDFIRTAMASGANTAIFPVQDLLGLGGEARMNVPGTVTNNWQWRLAPGALTREHAARLRVMCEDFQRLAGDKFNPAEGRRPGGAAKGK